MNRSRTVSCIYLFVSGLLFFLLACDSPFADAPAANTVTRAKYQAIRVDKTGKTGMTLAEVQRIMGFAGKRGASIVLSGRVFIAWQWQDSSNLITVGFFNNKAFHKSFIGY